MSQIQTILAYVGPLLLIALKVGVVIGGTGSLLEAIGKWRGWPKLVAIGQKLEAIGTDIPKLVGKIEKLLPPGNGSAVGPDDELPTRPLSQRPPHGFDAELGSLRRRHRTIFGYHPALAITGDVESELAELTKTYAPSLVECAVQQLVSDIGSGAVTARATRQVERGRAFLAKVQR